MEELDIPGAFVRPALLELRVTFPPVQYARSIGPPLLLPISLIPIYSRVIRPMSFGPAVRDLSIRSVLAILI